MADEREGSGMEVEAGEIPAAEWNVGPGFEVERMGLEEEEEEAEAGEIPATEWNVGPGFEVERMGLEEEEEAEAGEILETGESNGHGGRGMEGMQVAAPKIHGSGDDSSVVQINGQARVVEEEAAAAAIPQDVLLAAEAADALSRLPVPGKDEESEDSDEEEEDDDDNDEEGMVEEDSDPLVESDESSDSSSDEEEDDEAAGDQKAGVQKNHAEGVKELEKMVQTEKGGSSDDEDGVTEPPRTANEVTVLPPVPQVEAVLEAHQVPHAVGVVSSVMDKQVIVEAVEHKMVLNEGSILWLTEQRIPLGIVDEVFGPVKKPYYLVRYNKTSDVPEVASQGVTVGFVQEFANFVLNEAELRKKGYDASGQHDEEISDEDVEFSDDEKEEEAKRLRKQAAKQGHQVGEGVEGGRGGGRGGGGRQKAGGRGGRGRGGRGRFSRSDSMVENDDMAKTRTGGMGLQRSNSQGSPNYSRDKGSGIEHQSRGHFQPSPDRQNSWNRSPRPDTSYSQNLDVRPPMVNYNERQPLAFQSPHHEFVSGMRPMQQQPPHVSPQRAPAPPQWAPSSGPVHHVDVPQLHQGGYQLPDSMYQQRMNLVPMPYPHPQQMSMYMPAPPQLMGTGVFIPPPQYTRNSQNNQMQGQGQGQGQGMGQVMGQGQGQGMPVMGQVMGQMQVQGQGMGQMHGSAHPGVDSRGPVGQWPVNSPSIVTGIPCYSNPPPQIYMQPGTVPNPGMIAPGLSNTVYWTNNHGR